MGDVWPMEYHERDRRYIKCYAVNLIAVIYQFRLPRRNKKNLLKDEIHTETKAYQQVTTENK